ncbi:MAG: RNA polymerase sigma factor [Coriobacteriia bacterium]|nr:RNA polymerase sigma factor [Coriobacteriia bacterium]
MPRNWSNQELQDVARRYQPIIYRLALSYTRTVADAEDIMQEVFLRALKAHPSFVDAQHEKAWLLRVTINCCKSQLSSYWRRNVSQLADDAFNPAPMVATPEVASPEAVQESHARQESVLGAVARLPWKQRICVHLFYFEDASIEMIAQALNMNPSTVKSHLHRARLALKATLKEAYDEL